MGREGAIPVALLVPFMGPYMEPLTDLISRPIQLRVARSQAPADMAAITHDAQVVLTSFWNDALRESTPHLRFLQATGAGMDQIDLSALNGTVTVANCFEHEEGIAEFVLLQCLALSRRLLEADRALRLGDWSMSVIGGHPYYRELSGQTLGIVGFGRIGRSVARLARAFRLRIVVVTRSAVNSPARRKHGLAWAAGPAGLPRLLSEADFVVLALPLTDDSRNLIDRGELALMKRTGFIINIARAGIINESALFEALRDKTIAGAALDPWWAYPTAAGETKSPSNLPFADLPNIIMTPHVAGGTLQTIEKRARFMAMNIDRYLRGEVVLNVVQGPQSGTSSGADK